MKKMEKQNAKLVLKNGQEFSGQSFGFESVAQGEVVFTTGMTGFELSLTDPSFAGQILVFTFPLVGNFGVSDCSRDEFGILRNFESERIWPAGVVLANCSENFSHHSAQQSFASWLRENEIPAMCNVDTRALTLLLRESGAMPGQIVPGNAQVGGEFRDCNAENLVASVATKEVRTFTPKNFQKTILAVDTGVKNNILRHFLQRSIQVVLVPWDFSWQENEKDLPKIDGLFLANGPGDPRTILPEIAATVNFAREKNLPIFGICLGNQLLNLVFGGEIFKMKFGNRGVNQPVQDLQTGKCLITSQNHGFAICPESIPQDFQVWFRNLNDQSVEGIRHKSKPIFSVQFHPEACPGPQESEFLFDQFAREL